MQILAIGGSGHDYSFCYLKNGKIIRAIEEERLSREKHARGIRSKLFKGIEYCLHGLTSIDDLDIIITNNICDIGPIKEKHYIHNIVTINHHLAHAASSYYSSGFDDAAFVVIDGHGSIYHQYDKNPKTEILSSGYINRDKINFIETKYGSFKHTFTPSLGSFYDVLTNACGFGFNCEGKTMGLSSYGKPVYLTELMKHIDYDKHIFCNETLVELMHGIIHKDNTDIFQTKANLAASGQSILELFVYKLLNELYEKTKCPRLCLAGGVALNSVMNGKIKKHTPFKDVFIFPAANDGGTAIGAAYYAYYQLGKNKYRDTEQIKHVYYGKSYDDDSVKKSIQKYGNQISYKTYVYSDLINVTAQLIADDKIVGWFQGGSEAGPRALGNRSIIANPSNRDMKDILNSRVKFREAFRPFAPAVLKEKVHDYFDTEYPDNPFMLYICNVKKSKINEIPAVVHVDGTARFQTVGIDNNKKFYDLINAFYRIKGVPIVLNTSLNIKGNPIAETPVDAIECLLNSKMDCLIIENYLIGKNETK